jgi:hypothetical protein
MCMQRPRLKNRLNFLLVTSHGLVLLKILLTLNFVYSQTYIYIFSIFLQFVTSFYLVFIEKSRFCPHFLQQQLQRLDELQSYP